MARRETPETGEAQAGDESRSPEAADIYEGARQRAVEFVARLSAEPGSLERVVFLEQLRKLLFDLEAADVALLRENGATWAAIGRALGVSGQAVSMRFRPKE